MAHFNDEDRKVIAEIKNTVLIMNERMMTKDACNAKHSRWRWWLIGSGIVLLGISTGSEAVRQGIAKAFMAICGLML